LRNWIHDNGTHPEFDHGIYYGHGSGGLIANNLIEHNLAYGIQLYPGCRNALVTENTVVGNGRSGVIVGGNDEETATGNTIVNNVFADNREQAIISYWDGAVGGGNRASANLGYHNGPHGDPQFYGLYGGIELDHDIVADPLFVDQRRHDYRLRADSPAIDAGLIEFAVGPDFDGRPRPQGAGLDLGAFERPVP
jgi:parallel beta-helix repeat protein